jgi:hypothetical protein
MTYRLVLSITHDQFAAAINNLYYAVLNDPIKGLNSINLRMLITHIVMMYTQISQPNLDNNLTNFNVGIDPSLPLAIYTRKQEKGQVFALNAGVPISDAMMVKMDTKHTLACGNMMLTLREWKHSPIADHSWTNRKLHWNCLPENARHQLHDCQRVHVWHQHRGGGRPSAADCLIAGQPGQCKHPEKLNHWQPCCHQHATYKGIV